MLGAEAFVSLCTVVFSICAMGIYDVMSPGVAMILRWLMFTVTAATSVHLAYQIRIIELESLYRINGSDEQDDFIDTE